MDNKPYSYILFMIVLVLILLTGIIWFAMVYFNVKIEYLLFPFCAHFISLALAPVGWYSGVKFKSQDEQQSRWNRIGQRGNIILSVYLSGWIVFILLVNLKWIGK